MERGTHQLLQLCLDLVRLLVPEFAELGSELVLRMKDYRGQVSSSGRYGAAARTH